MKTEYTVWSETDKNSFEQAVEEYLHHGWKLAGGVSTAILIDPKLYPPIYKIVYTQSFTRYTRFLEERNEAEENVTE